jgi:hypothetical protein
MNSQTPDEKALSWYEASHETIVEDDLHDQNLHIVRKDVIGAIHIEKSSEDQLRRSLIRHDPEKLAKVIVSLL